MEDFAEQLAALKIDAQKIGYGMGGQLRNFNEETTIAVPRLAGPVLGVRLGEPKKKDD